MMTATPISPGQAEVIREMLSVRTFVSAVFPFLSVAGLWCIADAKAVMQIRAMNKIAYVFLVFVIIIL